MHLTFFKKCVRDVFSTRVTILESELVTELHIKQRHSLRGSFTVTTASDVDTEAIVN